MEVKIQKAKDQKEKEFESIWRSQKVDPENKTKNRICSGPADGTASLYNHSHSLTQSVASSVSLRRHYLQEQTADMLGRISPTAPYAPRDFPWNPYVRGDGLRR